MIEIRLTKKQTKKIAHLEDGACDEEHPAATIAQVVWMVGGRPVLHIENVDHETGVAILGVLRLSRKLAVRDA